MTVKHSNIKPPPRPLPQEPYIIGSWGPTVLAIGCAFAGVVLLIAAVCSHG